MIDKTELEHVLDEAVEVFTPEGALTYMISRNAALHDRTPLELLDQGDGRVVLDHLEALAAGVMS